MARTALLLLSVLTVTRAATAAEAGAPAGRVAYALEVAPVGEPTAAARACIIELDGLSEVTDRCSAGGHVEHWDGPVLWMGNSSGRTTWVAFIYEAGDGRAYKTPCYEMAPGAWHAVPDPAIERDRRRQVVIHREPGPGWSARGLRVDCVAQRVHVDPAPDWLDARAEQVARP